jgi:hypothetical protein
MFQYFEFIIYPSLSRNRIKMMQVRNTVTNDYLQV